MTPVKLSRKQKEAIEYMRKGYELNVITVIDPSAYLYYDGDSQPLNVNTLKSLREKGLIHKISNSFPSYKYELTTLGKEINID